MPEMSPSIRSRIGEHCLELLRVPSVTGNEADIAKYMRRWATTQRQLGRDDILTHNNALVLGHPDTRRPCVALVAHLDTVPPAPSDLAPHLTADRVVGRGASDMKGSIAVMQTLVETLELSALPFSLMLVFYDREEGPYMGNGLQPLLERYEPLRSVDLAICMEPTDNTLQLGCMGSIHARVTYRGKAAHSARPWQGENAIHKLGPLLVKLQNQKPRDIELGGLLFREAISATLVKGGIATNTVPPEVEINLNHRFAPTLPINKAVERAIAELKELAEGAAQFDLADVAPPAPVPNDNPVIEHLQRVAKLRVEPKQAWTDVARFAAFDIDAVNFGPGATAQAHQAGEWVALDALATSYEVLSRMLRTPMD